jgi:acetolactate synthase-1/2/3 large subunit
VTHRVVDHIVEYLSAIGVDFIFGVGGANIEDLYDAAYFSGDLTAILAKHEFSATTMADGYSRSGAGLGVVAATSGGGCLNTVPGLGEAFASRVPVLALIGQPPAALDGRGAFQDTSGRNGALDAEALFSAVSVYCRRVLAPSDIVSALSEAVAAARTGGPAVLLLPKDIQQAALPTNGGIVLPRATDTEPADLAPIAQALRRAAGPVTIIAGEQVARDDARSQLESLRALLGARLACVPDAKDVAHPHAAALGVSGVMGHPGVASALADSALTLVIGTRLNVTARAGLDTALASTAVYSLGSARPHVSGTHVHADDLRPALAALTDELRGLHRPWQPVSATELTPPRHDGPGIRYRDAMTILDRTLPDAVDIVVDAGNVGASAIHYLPVRRGGRFVVALGMGGMGYSFGAGIGMAFAAVAARARTGRPHPTRRTVVIAGDGAFFMHGMEIHTALHYRLPMTFLLFDNHAHAMCVTREQLFYHDLYSYNRFGPSRLGDGMAAMLPGLHATQVDDLAALEGALTAAFDCDGPSVVSIDCSPDEIPPFAAFLAAPTTIEETKHHVATRA